MCRKREGRVYIYKVDESLFFLVQKVVFKDSEFCSEKELEEGSKKGNKNFKKKKRKKEKGREEEEDETHFPPIEFILIHFLRRASFCRLHQKLSETVPREE